MAHIPAACTPTYIEERESEAYAPVYPEEGYTDSAAIPTGGIYTASSGGIFATETNGPVTIHLRTASTGADPAVTRNKALPSGGAVGVGGVFYDADVPDPANVPGVTLLAVNGNEGDQCGGDMTPLCTLPN